MKRWLNILALSWAGVALAHLPPPRPLELPPLNWATEEVVCRSWLSVALLGREMKRVVKRLPGKLLVRNR